ncbi:MAG: histidine--tRNA ligase [Bacteroidales bacterium]|nr:histidine--tRNA ligase [Bacteroidales bacterium]
MAIQKPSIPKGTRDFGPVEMSRRNYIFNTIKNVFRLHGYAQIETPAMETLDTLLGKYGEEGDKLLFKILNSGNFLDEIDHSSLIPKENVTELIYKLVEEVFLAKDMKPDGFRFASEKDRKDVNSFIISGIISSFSLNHLAHEISEKGLRYDLTVPFARFVVQHQHEIEFPFKRYQIQPVWRADRPQKGRYREFYQCDADIIGSNSLLNEADLLQIIDEVFTLLGIRVKIKLNNRKILSGIADYIGQPDKITDITVAIDKLEKIGAEAVNQELQNKGVSVQAIYKLEPVFAIGGSNAEKLADLKKLLQVSHAGIRGIEETETLIAMLNTLNLKSEVEIDISLARGLNYYTGSIIEVKALDVEIGSICGGGRYDDLTGIFGLKDISGVGISFGADRIYDVMEQLRLFPSETAESARVLLVNFGEKEALFCLSLLNKLHTAGIATELYPDAAKLKKQLSYADAKKVQFVVMAGENEIREGQLTVKNMVSGEQVKVIPEDLVKLVS